MNFLPTAEQDMLRHSVAATLARGGGLSDLGVFALLVPEARGGSGLGMTEAAIVLHEAGRAGRGGDLAAGMLFADALGQARPDLAPRVLAGDVAILTPVAGECRRDGARLSAVLTCAVPGAGAWIAAPMAGLDVVALIPADGIPRDPLAMLEADRDACRLKVDLAAAEVALVTVPVMRDRMALLACAEMLGVANNAFALTLGYLKDRHQFGQPIGANQALKHIAADTYLHLENSRVAVDYAAAALDAAQRDPDRATRAMAVLRAHVPATAREILETAIHLHGGIGLTWDYGLNAPLRRILRLGMAMGAPDGYRQMLSDMVLAGKGNA
jgi:alkylation response protein AidB-like acyl-CoA dehydrogenase